MLKIGTVKWKGKCPNHPKYNPAIDGQGAIRGGCGRCGALFEIHKIQGSLMRAMREFGPARENQKRKEPELDLQQKLFEFPEAR